MRIATAAAALCLSTMTTPALAEADRYVIDPAHFSIVFNANHIDYGNTWGMFLEGSGSFMFDEEARTVSDVVVEVNTTSVFSNHEGRDEHARSEDFLHAEAYPVARFEMTEANAESDTEGTITGDLTLRGVTQPVTLDVTFNKAGQYPWGNNYVVGVTATTTIKRSDFGSTYALEGNLVGDEIPLVFELEAIRQDD